MTKHNKWITGLVLGSVTLIGISSLAFTQRTWRYCNSWSGRVVPNEYRLNQEQTREVEKMRAEYQQKILPLEQQLAGKRDELDAEWARSDSDPNRIQELRSEVHDLEYKIENIQIEADSSFVKKLSPEQRPYYADLCDTAGSSGWPCRWDRSSRDNRMMNGRRGSGNFDSRGKRMNHGCCL